jgi:hypothetical protein
MTNATAAARSEDLTPEEKASLRYAMLSVYFRSLGSQLETRGAPVIAVPPEVRPLTLDEALDRLEQWPERLWDAYWRIVRAVPVEGWDQRRLESRYPSALVDRLGSAAVRELDERRRRSRAGAHLFAAALVACAEKRWPEADVLANLLEEQAGDDGFQATQEFNTTAASVLGRKAPDFLRWLVEPDRQGRTAEDLCRLQAEVGLNLYDFVEDFADTVAFADFKRELEAPPTLLTSSCIVRQDTNTLTTTATATTLVQTTFDVLRRSIDPLGWPKCSDVIRETKYVAGAFDLSAVEEEGRALGQGYDDDDPQLLFEKVGVQWGLDEVQTGEFQNVLTIDRFAVDKKRGTITLPFKLCRSIDSRILWDYRAGGILIDGGYIVARPVGADRWRVTSRKVLKFSDRTPYANSVGWPDFGQMLNYLAPAAVTWWLETELYSADCLGYAQDDPPARGPVQHVEGRS